MEPGLRWINKQGVESTEGFVVQFMGRFSLRYQNGSFVMDCPVDHGSPYLAVAVPELPFGNLTPKIRSEIVQRISAAFDFMEVNHVIQ
jgi:hypothetical protein